jgi:DNA transposition AAA+ family ATPase
MKIEFYQRVKEHLEVFGIKQSWLADKTGLANSTISMYLNGETGLSTENESKINELLFPVELNTTKSK